jgi:hypothetical protein
VIRTFVLLAAALFINTALAQDDADEYAVVLPEEAQKCVLPAAPDAIPENATLDQLKKAKADIGVFQAEVGVFRDCLDAAQDNPDNTDGNKQAIISSFNYSVEMEERVAARFNEAIRDYKERNAQ